MKIAKIFLFFIIGIVPFSLEATEYYFCNALTFSTKVPKEQGDSFVVYYSKEKVTLIDQIHGTNLSFVKHVKQGNNEYDLYQKIESDTFNYMAKVYRQKKPLIIKLTRYNKLDKIDLPETSFKCNKGSNEIEEPTTKNLDLNH